MIATKRLTRRDFLDMLFEPDDKFIEMRCIDPVLPEGHREKVRKTWLTFDELADRDTTDDNAAHCVYVGINPRTGRASGDANVSTIRNVWADFDDGLTWTIAEDAIDVAGLPHPSLVAHSGGGTHVYWRLTEEIDHDTFRAVQSGLARVLNSDAKVKNPERIMRLPDTINRKPARNGAECLVVAANDERHDLDDILKCLPPEESVPIGTVPEDLETTVSRTPNTAGAAIAMLGITPKPTENDGSNRLLAWCCRGVEHGLDDDAIVRTVQACAALPGMAFKRDYGVQGIRDRIASARNKTQPQPELMKADTVASPLSIGNLVQSHPTLRPPVIDGLLRRGETANVIAAPKVGKSWWAYGLAVNIATGGYLFGAFACTRGRALLVDNELHGETLAARLPRVAEAMGVAWADIADRIDILTLRGKGVDLHKLSRHISRIQPGEYAAIIADAWYRFIPAGLNENSNADVMGLYNRLDEYAAQTDAAWVVVHHTSKGSQGEKAVTDVGAGAGAQSRAADTHIVLRPHEEEGCVVMEAAVRSFKPVEPLGLRWEYPTWNRADSLDTEDLKGRKSGLEERQEHRDVQAMNAIRHALRRGPLTPRGVRDELGYGPDRAARLLGKLNTGGEVTIRDIVVRGNPAKEYSLVE